MERDKLKHITLMARYLADYHKKIDEYQSQYYTMLKELAAFQKGIELFPLELMFLSEKEPLEPIVRKGKESMVASDTACCLSCAQEHLEKSEEVLKEIFPILKTYSDNIDKLYEVNKSLGECISNLADVAMFDDEEYEEMKKKSFIWRWFYEKDA